MAEEVDFLFDEQLVAELVKLIRSAKHKLLLISPFIDLDARITEALAEKKELHNFELQVLFGKNENNYQRSMKRNSMEFLKQFPNIEIRYNERLHAKFYMNDFTFIMTSLNLYDYSLANNIEVGVKCEYASKGLLGKALDLTTGAIGQGVDKVKQDVIGIEKSTNPIEKFTAIFEASALKFKTRARIGDKGGITGLFGAKKLHGYEVLTDELQTEDKVVADNSQQVASTSQTSIPVNTLGQQVNAIVENAPVQPTPTIEAAQTPVQDKCVSASQLSKAFGVSVYDINNLMQRRGLISNGGITPLGFQKGLVIKSELGQSYIAYPDTLAELNEFRM